MRYIHAIRSTLGGSHELRKTQAADADESPGTGYDQHGAGYDQHGAGYDQHGAGPPAPPVGTESPRRCSYV